MIENFTEKTDEKFVDKDFAIEKLTENSLGKTEKSLLKNLTGNLISENFTENHCRNLVENPFEKSEKNLNYLSGKFIYNGKIYSQGPRWNMSLKINGSMRFRWNEKNQNRISFLSSVACEKKIAQIELIHSKNIFYLETESDLENLSGKKGDGILTKNKNFLPVITVADCVPVYIFDVQNKISGVLHSGWKGTGICGDAIKFLQKKFKSKPENICVVIGPHINECCYEIDKNRAEYFKSNFGENCVFESFDEKYDLKKYSLSLTVANLNVLQKLNVPQKNILVSKECTCCSGEKFGSFRRETSLLPENMSLEEKSKKFTVQAAWISW